MDEEDEMFYVGQTIDPEERLKQHKEKYGEKIWMSLLKKVPDPWANYYEAIYIKMYLQGGAKLKNKQLYDKMPPVPSITEEEYEILIKSKKYEKEQKTLGKTKEVVNNLKEINRKLVEKNRVLNVELLRLEEKIDMLHQTIYGMREKAPLYVKGFDDSGQIILSVVKNTSKNRPKLFYKPLKVNLNETEIMQKKMEEIRKQEEEYFHLINTRGNG